MKRIGKIDPILKVRIKKARHEIDYYINEVKNHPNSYMSCHLLRFWHERLDERCQKIKVVE